MDEADLICSVIEFQSLGTEKENVLSPNIVDCDRTVGGL